MKKYLKIIAIAVFSILGTTTIISSPTLAADADVCSTNVPDSVKEAAGCNSNTDSLQSAITNILSAIIGVAGLVSVAYIIVGGIQYMTSSGDSSKTEKAKKTILYALIGLVVCALSFAIVNFAISRIIYNNNSSSDNDESAYENTSSTWISNNYQ